MNDCKKDDNDRIALAIKEMEEEGALFKPNVPELMKRAEISRQRARRIAANGFKLLPHGNAGMVHIVALSKEEVRELDSMLTRGVTNSNVILRVIREKFGYNGSKSSVDRMKKKHSFLIPAPREVIAEQGARIKRYETGPGEMYQMDWGFVNVRCVDGTTLRLSVFAMVCHHCGMMIIEFFPNSRQQNLFIGMVHAFIYMGMPKTVLTDNMASVSNRRDPLGNPIMNTKYNAFQKACGFTTKLCKPRHPYTKGYAKTFVMLRNLSEMAFQCCPNVNPDSFSLHNIKGGTLFSDSS